MFQAHLEERFCCGVAGCRCGGHTGLLLSPALCCLVASALLAWLRKAQEACISQPSLHVADSSFSLCPGLVCSAFSVQVKKRVGVPARAVHCAWCHRTSRRMPQAVPSGEADADPWASGSERGRGRQWALRSWDWVGTNHCRLWTAGSLGVWPPLLIPLHK